MLDVQENYIEKIGKSEKDGNEGKGILKNLVS